MTVTDSQYIINLDRSGVTPTEDEEFDIPFAISDATELIVWTIVDSVYTRRRIGLDYRLLGDKIIWIGMAPSEDMRIQRHVKYDQPNRYKATEPKSIEKGLDDMCLRSQQQLPVDPLQPLHFDAGGESICNMIPNPDEEIATAYMISKEDVDAKLSDTSGTNTFFIKDENDVGKYLKTNMMPAPPTWEDVSGAPDPKGQEGKYLTEGGWETFGVIPTAKNDEQQLLKDVDGVPTWTPVDEVPTDDQQYGRLLSRDTDPIGPTIYSKWRNGGQLPVPLGKSRGQFLQKKEDNTRYQWKGRILTTKHYASFALTPSISVDDGVEIGAVQYPIHDTSIQNPFSEVPQFLGCNIEHWLIGSRDLPLGTRNYYNYSYQTGSPRELLYKEHGAHGEQMHLPVSVSIISVDEDNVLVSAAHMLNSYAYYLRYVNPGTTDSSQYGANNIAMSPVSPSYQAYIHLMWYFDE